MGEQEPRKETIVKGNLYFLSHQGDGEIFSGYGLTTRSGSKENLVGLLMVDRPNPVDPAWLRQIENAFGEYQLVPMSASGERGILCRMGIEPDSLTFLEGFPIEKANNIQEALQPLLDQPPEPSFLMHWNSEKKLWASQIQYPNELPKELREVMEKTGYGCLAVEADIGVVHVCHTTDADIAVFKDKPVISCWNLIKMPSAPLIRLELIILDKSENPFRFESFLNVASEDQLNILAELANQDHLYLAFYGDDLSHRYTKIIPHDIQQWRLLDELTGEAKRYWKSIPQDQRDFDMAKEIFIRNT